MDTDVTVLTLVDNTIARAKDEYKNQWTDSQLLIFVNKAVDFVHKLLVRVNSEIATTDVDVPMISATQEYSLATYLPDFWSMRDSGVYFSAVKTPLTPATHEDKLREGTTTTSAAPTAYYITATHMGVINIPNSTSVAAYPTLKCRYFKKNPTLTLLSNMPYKNLFNEPVSSFVDHLAVLKTTAPTAELTAIYNALEASAMEIAMRRTPL